MPGPVGADALVRRLVDLSATEHITLFVGSGTTVAAVPLVEGMLALADDYAEYLPDGAGLVEALDRARADHPRPERGEHGLPHPVRRGPHRVPLRRRQNRPACRTTADSHKSGLTGFAYTPRSERASTDNGSRFAAAQLPAGSSAPPQA